MGHNEFKINLKMVIEATAEKLHPNSATAVQVYTDHSFGLKPGN